MVNSSYTKIRELLLDDMTSIIKLPDDVFEDAKVETIIFEYRKNCKSPYVKTIVYAKSGSINYIDDLKSHFIAKDNWKRNEGLNFNIYLSDNQLNLLEKIRQGCIELNELADFSLGITPYDKYKGHSTELMEDRGFHSTTKIDDTYKPLISGTNIKRYLVSSEVKEYIKYGDWLGAAREERFFTEPRIIVRQIVSGDPPRIYAGYTEEPLYFTQIGFGIISKNDSISLKTLLALLNSKLINFYHKYTFLDLEKRLFQKILIANCKKFPIPINRLNNQHEIDKMVDRLIDLNKELQRNIEALYNFILSKYRLQSDSNKLHNWNTLAFSDFINELEKVRKRECKERNDRFIKMTINEEAEWESYLKAEQEKVKELECKINNADLEIDQIVYDLYGLTVEEIEIVENSVKS